MTSNLGRRSWSREQKRRVVDEALVPGASVAEVARRYELNANLLFKWLRQAGHGRRGSKRADLAVVEPGAMEFVSLGVVAQETGGAVLRLPRAEVSPRAATPAPSAKGPERRGVIEIELLGGVRLRVDAFVNQAALRRVLLVMKDCS
jgi:transposase